MRSSHLGEDQTVRHSLLLVLPLVFGASGCASTVEPPATQDRSADATVIWGNWGHGGAAGRVPGYVHALAKEATFRPRSEATVKIAATGNYATATPSRAAPPEPAHISPAPRDPIVEALAAAMRQPAPEVAPLPTQRSAQSESPAAIASADDQLRNAWEKYCRGGADMSDEEWGLVNAAGAPQNVPADLTDVCVHAK
jgi:hypothetical protein